MFKIVSSSAGSGKTYTLTKEYLKLALQSDNAYYFKHILAITFTKAATREMKDRIMVKLEAFANGHEDPMLHDIIQELYPESLADREGAYKLRERDIRNRANRVFKQILHDYSDFAILTIDSFVQRVVSAFTDELGIPFSFEVEMEAGELLLMAVERMLEKTGDDAYTELTDILESFYLEAGQEGKNYHSLPEAMAGFANDLLNEQRYAAIMKNAHLSAKDFKKIRRQLVSALRKWENQLVQWAEKGHQLILESGLDEKDFSYGTVFRYFKKRTDTSDAMTEPGAREKDAFENDKGWLTKTARPFVVEAVAQIKPQLVDFYERIEENRLAVSGNYFLYQQLIPHLYHLSLLNEIKEEFDRQLRENNRVHISEFNQKILQIVTEDPVPFIYERMGEKFNHILIDEFQDTSKLQFANVLPLIDNSLGYDHFNLAVGDSKQAIYRFRGGDMDQIIALHSQNLDRLAQSLGDSELTVERLESIQWHLTGDVLRVNRRSAKEIIEFNNAFFGRIEELYRDQFPLSHDVFEQVAQELPPNPKTGGEVQIEFIPALNNDTNDDDDTPAMINRTLALIQQATEIDGFSVGDISVLCRYKKDAKKIANHLKENGYNIISDDSLSLRFSGAVNLVTAFMRVLVKPDSRLDKYEALYLFFRMIVKRIPDNKDNQRLKTVVESHDVREFYVYINECLRQVKAEAGELKEGYVVDAFLNPYRLLQISAYELAEKLVQTFGLFEIVDERDYLFRFLDVVLEFNTKRGSHLADFLDYWETQKEKISISAPSDPNAITVQTIHRSKGLEYPVVIIPYADWDFVPNAKRDSMWVNLDKSEELGIGGFGTKDAESGEMIEHTETKWLQTGSVQVKETLLQTTESVALQYKEERERVFVENLNLLYVAFTRPTKKLYVLAKEENFAKIKSPRKVSYWLYQYLESTPEPAIGSLETLAQLAPRTPHATLQAPTFYVPQIISTDRSRELRLRRLANRIFDVETFEKKRDHGNKVHRALSMVRTPEDVPSALVRLQTEGIIDNIEAEDIRKSLDKILQHPDLQGLFEMESNVINEREILTPDGNIHRPDRVVHLNDRVVIVDYKTGIPLESHTIQIKRYAKLFYEMGYPRVESLLVYIERNEVIRV
ncbi:UvrD-helicase domain-containing protein [Runella sp. CRIBMP]|uniref:UvrD-helicase domain-containing protein n=1 Tax=Runella sp. CRIBMP TaxID=2683261 RepID=UPI001411E74F|nr:UvrD-helicase domain-containing protein [Runella sp. CRIBMP]NBB20730.1 UvrD-helicase domain-containing protein [Runella sp. CRIBMP]